MANLRLHAGQARYAYRHPRVTRGGSNIRGLISTSRPLGPMAETLARPTAVEALAQYRGHAVRVLGDNAMCVAHGEAATMAGIAPYPPSRC